MLKELSVSDTGLYTCRVTTELGTKTSESNIKVLGKDIFNKIKDGSFKS